MVTREPHGNRRPTMASGRGKSSNVPSLQQLLREEALLKKAAAYAKLVQSWEQGRVICLQKEKQEERIVVQACQRLRAGVAEELWLANKELLMVRRAALRCLLLCEHLQHQRELRRDGKSFYAERL